MELNTERLKLRQWKDSDLPIFAEMNSCDEVMKYFPNKLSESESNSFAKKLSSLIAERGWGLWAVEIASTNEFIGFTGLHYVHKKLSFSPAVEIGWRLKKQSWGKGYATEAANKVLKIAFTKLGINELVSITSVINLRSRAVMEKIKMENTNENFQHPLIEEGNPLREHVLYKIAKIQWLAKSL